MSGLAALALWLQAAAALAGSYHTQQIEVGAALELQPDGHFRYMLDYGAVSEAAEGRWTADGGLVRLTSEPLPLDVMRAIEHGDAAFAGEPLAVDGETLVLRRFDTSFTFYRDQP